MIKKSIQKLFNSFGYKIDKIPSKEPNITPDSSVPKVNAIWPLPNSGSLSDKQIKLEFSKYAEWHYPYEFEGGLSFSPHYVLAPHEIHKKEPNRHFQRFSHFMPYLGNIKGKRILDIACNSGFWSFQCALMGASVVGFDARKELLDQANLIKKITGIENVEFKELDFWEMNPKKLGMFDIVMNLGILYHLPNTVEALKLTKQMAKEFVLLDTRVYKANDSLIKLVWEEPRAIIDTSNSCFVSFPSKKALELMFKHLDFKEWIEIPIRTKKMPRIYLENKRASWLVKV